MLTVLAGRQVAAGMSISVWVEIAAAAAGSIIKDSFSVLSEIKGDTFQVSCMYHVPLCAVVGIMRARQPRAQLPPHGGNQCQCRPCCFTVAMLQPASGGFSPPSPGQVPIHATVVESAAPPAPSSCIDEQGQVQVVEHLAKVIAPLDCPHLSRWCILSRAFCYPDAMRGR